MEIENKIKPMSMTKEERILYNKKYYSTNKERILKDLASKIRCEQCNSKVSKSRLLSHMKTSICNKRKSK